MTLSEQINLVEKLQKQHPSTGLKAVEQSLNHLMGMYQEIAPKYELYSSFVGAYYDFIIDQVPLFDFTGRDGKELKKIIAKLLRAKGIQDEEGALNAFKFILTNWSRLNSFMQSQKSVPQINKYLVEILDQLKNGHYQTPKQSTAAKSVNDTKSAIENRRRRKSASS